MNDYDAQSGPNANREQDELSAAMKRAQQGEPSGDALIDALIGLQPQANPTSQKSLEDALIKRMNTIHPNGHGTSLHAEAPITIEELKMTHKPKMNPQKRKRSEIPWTIAVAAIITVLVAGGLFFANQRNSDSQPYASGEVDIVTSTPVSSGPTDFPPTVPPPGQGAPVVTVTPTFVPTSTPMPTVRGGATSTFAPTSTPFLTGDIQENMPCQILSHTVEEGDTLMAISGFYEVSIDEIARVNDFDNSQTLEVGDLVAVPAGNCVFIQLQSNIEALTVRSEPVLDPENEIGVWTDEDDLSLVIVTGYLEAWEGRHESWLSFANLAANFSEDEDIIRQGWVSSDYVELIGSLEHVPQLQPFAAYTATPFTSAQIGGDATGTFTATPVPTSTSTITPSPTFTQTPVPSLPAMALPTYTPTFIPTEIAPRDTGPNMDYMVMIAIAVTNIPANTLIEAHQFTIGYMPRYGDSDNGQVLDQEIIEVLQSGGRVYATETIPARSIISHDVAEARLGLPDVPEGHVAVAIPISRLGGDILPALPDTITPGDHVHVMAELRMVEQEDGSTCVQSIDDDCHIETDETPVQIASLEIRDSIVLRAGILATMSLSVENAEQIDDLLQDVFVIGIASDELDIFNWLMEENIAFTLIPANE